MAAIPWAYYVHGEDIADLISLTPIQVVASIGIAAIILESLRIKTGFLIVGQREYEKHQTSALAWGAVSIALTIIALSPWEGSGTTHAGWLTVPIILSLTFGDPAMGEARRMGMENRSVYAIGTIICGLIWLVCGYFLGTPYWMAPEVFKGDRYTEKCDVYSFGVVVWECVTRKLPFLHLPTESVPVQVALFGLRPEIPEDCPMSVKKLMEWCWEAEPSQRPSFTEILNSLRSIKSAVRPGSTK